MFEIVDNEVSGPIIKVIGVGGAGGNAVNHMIDQGVQGVEFIAVNTDAQALLMTDADVKLQVDKGLKPFITALEKANYDITDQFGPLRLGTKKPFLLCNPCTKAPA